MWYPNNNHLSIGSSFKNQKLQMTKMIRQKMIDELILLEEEKNFVWEEKNNEWSSPITHYFCISGKLELTAFLERIWNLHEMLSTDPRFKTAVEDIRQHMINNSDWNYHYLFNSYLGLLEASDEIFFKFIEELVHPIVRYSEEQTVCISIINKYINKEGFKLQAITEISGHPIYSVVKIGRHGIKQNVKNLIFAANGPKPEIVLDDSISNNVKIVKNEEYCLVYDLPISETGLKWVDIVDWWSNFRRQPSIPDTERNLYVRLKKSLDSEPEKLLFDTYYRQFHKLGDKLPALIPQVYLHYDPYTIKFLGYKRLPRQRMDFLILFSNSERVVIEIDGKQHYANGDIASPKNYAEMVAADRELRLAGYEIYRFGGYELQNDNIGKATAVIENFFHKLLQKHSISTNITQF